MTAKREATSDATATADATPEESEELYRSMIELSPDGIFTLDTEGVILGCNRAAASILTLSKDEIIGRHFSGIGVIAPQEIPEYRKLFGSVLGGAPPKSTELTLHRPDGTTLLADVRGNLLKVAGQTIIQTTLRDISRHKRLERERKDKNEQLDAQNEELRATEEELRASNEELQAANECLSETQKEIEADRNRLGNIMENMVDGIGVTDIQGRIIQANRAHAEMAGYDSPDELIGRTFLENVAPEDLPGITKRFRESKRTREKIAKNIEFMFVRKDGSRFPAMINAANLWNKKGDSVEIIAVIRDITERKRMEEALRNKNEQLDAQNEELKATEDELRAANEELKEAQEQMIRSEKLAAIGQLAGGVGHELRNPLGAIKNAAYYIRSKLTKNELAQQEPRVMEFLDIIDEEINASSKIISDLLNFSRTGKPTVSAARITPVIDNTLSRIIIPENIIVTTSLNAGLPEIRIDTDQIRQVLVNLITNACQTMPAGGRLSISARTKDGSLEIAVADTGDGIPAEIAGKIFDPLFTTKAKGIGLGLAVCKSIIENHRGGISVSSEVGKGTTFLIKLPLNVTESQGRVSQ